MANKYLEKIAGAKGVLSEIGSSAIRLARKGVTNTAKAVGNQFHLADGGSYRDFAHSHLNIKDPSKLADFDGSKKGIKSLKRAATDKLGRGASFADKKQALREIKKHLPQLREKQTDGRMLAGLAVGGTAYGIHKARENTNGQDTETYRY